MEYIERWRDVIGHENSYWVSDWGRVLSLPKQTRRGKRELRQSPDTYGYQIVTLHRLGKQKTRTVHQLVAEAFIAEGPIPAHLEANHCNGDKRNNRRDNLELLTQLENSRHATRVLGHRKGEQNPAAKLNPVRVQALRNAAAAGASYIELGLLYSVSAVQARNVARGRAWPDAPGPIETEPRPLGRRAR